MSAIDQLFQDLRSAGKKAFMPFITAGDPDLNFTVRVLRELASRGCHMCEVGVPYSDPIADGPVIQASYNRALERRIKLADVFQHVAEVQLPQAMPMVAMVSYSIIFRHGLNEFVAHAQQAGFSGAIVPDLLVEESQALSDVCRREDFSLIPLITPTTGEERARKIAATATGFIYYVSVKGVTGERQEMPAEVIHSVESLRRHTDVPICIGFGISRPEHVRMASKVADGVIVGSAVVRRFAALADQAPDDVLADIGNFADEMLRALPA
jgi:tryptophan synthase alpha chain